MATVNEKSPLYMTIVFTDEVGDPLIPTTVEWRLDNTHEGADSEIVAWTSAGAPSASMTIVIPSGNNLIVDEASIREERTFGIRVDDGLDAEAHQELKYHVLNLFSPTGT